MWFGWFGVVWGVLGVFPQTAKDLVEIICILERDE